MLVDLGCLELMVAWDYFKTYNSFSFLSNFYFLLLHLTLQEKNKTLYVMWSVPLNTIVYENWWSATVVDGEQQANNHTHNAMYYGTSGMPDPLRSGGWKCRNINSFSLNGCMSTNGQATLELDVKSL
jgi:hypothetical protein